jgi:serine O-acetyltransferase
MFERFGRDVARYFSLESGDGKPGLAEKVRIVLRSPTLHAIAVHRVGSWLQTSGLPRPVSLPLKAAHKVASTLTHMAWGIEINDGADIGGGFYIGHPGAVIIGPVKMGRDCSVSERVTIGRRTDGNGKSGTPEIGDRVWIGTGSVIFGQIRIGSGASVAPLTMVGRNVPPRALVLGNPMQVLKRDHDNSFQTYGANPPADTITVPSAVRPVAEADASLPAQAVPPVAARGSS